MKQGKDRQYYENLFCDQPDVLDTTTVRELLGGIGIKTMFKLTHEGHLKHFRNHGHYILVPKIWLIDYIMSDHYQGYKHKLKHQIKGEEST